MGVEHGAYCLGCCALLMTLLFVGGVMNLLWVAVIAMVHLLGFVWALAQLRADGRELLADEIAEAGVVDVGSARAENVLLSWSTVMC